MLEGNYHEKFDDLDKRRTVMDVMIKLKNSYHPVTIRTSISQASLISIVTKLWAGQQRTPSKGKRVSSTSEHIA
jgi:hypothetical protein